MIRYKIYENRSKKSAGNKKFYVRAVSEETIDLRQLADYMATHYVAFSRCWVLDVGDAHYAKPEERNKV